jgi:hypothetical protein
MPPATAHIDGLSIPDPSTPEGDPSTARATLRPCSMRSVIPRYPHHEDDGEVRR